MLHHLDSQSVDGILFTLFYFLGRRYLVGTFQHVSHTYAAVS
jgi:hypothetical protein